MFSRILIPVDLDEPEQSRSAVAVGRQIADCFGARLTICTIVTDLEAELSGQWLPISYQELLAKARAKAALFSQLNTVHIEVEVEVGTGTVSGGILDVAQRVSADLIVMTSHQPGVGDYLWSGHAARVARRAACSVLVVRAGLAAVREPRGRQRSARPRARGRPARPRARGRPAALEQASTHQLL